MDTMSETCVASTTSFRYTVAILLLILLPDFYLPVAIQAQPAGLKIGDKVRIKAPSIADGKLVGNITDLLTQTMGIATNVTTLTISYRDIESLDVARGKKSNILRGLLIGGGGGAILGGLIGLASYSPCNSSEWFGCFLAPDNRGEALGMGILIGGVFGGISGLITGFLYRTPRWVPVPLKPSLTLIPTDFDKRHYYPALTLRWPLR